MVYIITIISVENCYFLSCYKESIVILTVYIITVEKINLW